MMKIFTYLLAKIRKTPVSLADERPIVPDRFTAETNREALTELPVSVVVRQITNGTHYQGEVRIAEVEFSYDLLLIAPFRFWAYPSTVDEYRRMLRITLRRRGGEIIELIDDEFEFFAPLVSRVAFEFYDSFQVRLKNKQHQHPGAIKTNSLNYSFSTELYQKLFGDRVVA